MIVKYSNEKIFWNTIGENKPSKSYLDALENRMVEQDIKINFDDFYNISIVSSRKDITYLLTTHNGYKQYWFFNGISKIVNGGYVIKFQLDVYCTYTLTIIENMKRNNADVRLDRTHKFSEDMLYINDEMLDNVPITYDGVDVIETKPLELNEVQYAGKTYYEFIGSDISGFRINKNSNFMVSTSVYYAFLNIDTLRKSERHTLTLIPVLSGVYASNFPDADSTYYIKVGNTWEPEIGNKLYVLNDMLAVSENYERFLGVFVLPPAPQIKYPYSDSFGWVTKTIKAYDGNGNIVNGNVPTINVKAMCLNVPFHGFNMDQKWLLEENNISKYNVQVNKNTLTNIHQLFIDKFNYKLFNQEIPVKFFVDDNGNLSLNKYYIGLGQSSYVKLVPNTSKNYFYLNTCLIEPSNVLPYPTNDFLKYLSATRNTRDTQLGIYRQQQNIGIYKNLWDLGTGLLSNDEGPIRGALSSISSFIGGVGNNVVSYNNQVNMLNAGLRDAQNSMGTNYNASSTLDGFKAVIYLNGMSKPATLIEKQSLTQASIKALNNVLYLYGHASTFYENINNAFVRSDFNYLLFNSQFLTTIFMNYVNENIPTDLHSFIIKQLSNGVRIWNTQPNN